MCSRFLEVNQHCRCSATNYPKQRQQVVSGNMLIYVALLVLMTPSWGALTPRELTDAQKEKVILLTTWGFLNMCPEGSGAKELLEKLSTDEFPGQLESDKWNVMGVLIQGIQENQNASLDYLQLPTEDKLKYILYGFIMSMCGAAQEIVGEVQMLEAGITPSN
ncbi:uncharacterized protein LOC106050253 isoform X1 [Biomphalaria glabrata]|uniref:Uncharacterized protein LOC106050253 isoform X1 n=2 Tax=Biomphalaria glabrata TaxID=6526 RepID=A0A9W2Z736_BIOGL|nr:uncharacterized protein LOC106050253 isoform X1 [Biomphalaria glabrata]